MPAAPQVILYHYPYSPYARKVFWYLRLRSIPFFQCIQPPILPRPDLSEQLGITYRRIPVCAIDADVYCDSSLIIRELEKRFPYGKHETCGGTEKLVEVEKWKVEGVNGNVLNHFETWADEVFVTVVGRLLPPDLPLLKDEKFRTDRARFWPKGRISGSRDEALATIRSHFTTVETVYLAGDKKWILSGENPDLVDILAIWSLHWVTTLPNALAITPGDPTSPAIANPQTHPRTFAWISRFNALLESLPPVKTSIPTVTGAEAKSMILASPASSGVEVGIDPQDPLMLNKGELIEVVPTDSGVLNPQRGRLVGLEAKRVVVEVDVPGKGEEGAGKTVRVWFPRINYSITKVGGHEEKARI